MAELDFSKFEGLFKSMERQLVMQTSFLESMYNMSVEEREDRNRRESNERLERVTEYSRESAFNEPLDQRTQQQVEPSSGGMLASILGGIPGMLSNISLGGAGKLMLKGGLAAMIAPAVGEFVAGFVSQGLDELGELGFDIPEEFKAPISNAIGDAAKWGTIGKLIGGRFGLILGTTGFIYDQLKAQLDPDGNGAIEGGFLDGFNADVVSAIGASIAAALAFAIPKLISRNLGRLIAGGTAAPPVRPPATSGATPTPTTKPPSTPAPAIPNAPKGGGMFNRLFRSLKKIKPGNVAGMAAQFAGYALFDKLMESLEPDVPDLDVDMGADMNMAILKAASDLAVSGKPEEAAKFVKEATSSSIFPWRGNEDQIDPRAVDPEFWKAWAEQKRQERIEDLKAQGLYGEFDPSTNRISTSEMIIPGITTDTTGAIVRSKPSVTNGGLQTNGFTYVAPTPVVQPTVTSAIAPKVTRLEQDAMELRRQTAAGNVAIGGATSIGGSTTNNNNQNTVINNYVRPEVVLDHFLP
jgi:hypothetical protein